MEVLNQNQRRSAIWRLFGLGILVLTLVSTTLISMHNTYAGQGTDEIEKLKKEHKKKQNSWIAEKEDLQNKNRALETKNKKLQKEIEDLKGSPDERIKIFEARLEEKDDIIERLDKDLDRCQREVKQANANQ